MRGWMLGVVFGALALVACDASRQEPPIDAGAEIVCRLSGSRLEGACGDEPAVCGESADDWRPAPCDDAGVPRCADGTAPYCPPTE